MAKDKIEKVIAYVGPQVSSRDDRCVHLYPEMPGGARYRCCTVYEERFNELPYGIGEQLMTDEIIPGSAPEMEPAKSQGILQYCSPFMIEVKLRDDGSKSKDLDRVIGPVTASVDASSVPASRAFEQALEGLEFHKLDKVTVANQTESIATETYWKMTEALTTFAVMVDTLSIPEHLHETVFLATWRDINDQYRVVRPALLTAKESVEYAPPDGNQIFIGERASFLEDVATQHMDIKGSDAVKSICEALGITGSDEESAVRVEQAKQIWLFSTMVNAPFNITHEEAVAHVLAALPLDDVPF